MAASTSSGRTVYDEVVCPEMGCPPRSHWMACWTPGWSQVGAVLVRTIPTLGVPWIDGGAVAWAPLPSMPVMALLRATVGVRPGSVPVARSVIEALRSPATTSYVDEVAPVM